MSPEDIQQAHKHSIRNRQEVLGSYICGCFHYLADFYPKEITVWWGDDTQGIGQTVVSLRCNIGSVIGSGSGFPIDGGFFSEVRRHWFTE